MLVLGLGLGFVMQVLVLAVQNAVDYRDLGVATSGATLFRSMGGSVGVPIFGAIFATSLRAALRRTFLPGSRASPRPTARADRAHFRRDSRSISMPSSPRFARCSSPPGSRPLGFVATWFLREGPLARPVADQGIGDSFACRATPPRSRSWRLDSARSPGARTAIASTSTSRGSAGSTSARRSVAAAALRRRRFAHARRACGSPGRPRRRPPAAGHGAARARVAGGGDCIGGRAPTPDRGRPRRDARDGRGAPRRTRALPRRLAARAAPRGPAAARALRPVAARTPSGRRAGSRLAPRRARRHSGTRRGAPRASNRARRPRSWLPCPWMARGRPIRPRTR